MANTKRKTKASTKKKSDGFTIPEFDSGDRIKKFFGLFLLLVGAILFVSFFSYFFTRQADDSWVKDSVNLVSDSSIRAENWLGRLGAYLAHSFMYKSFGLGAFGLVGMTLISGWKLLYSEFTNSTFSQLIRILWLVLIVSLTCGFLISFQDNSPIDFIGGEIGVSVITWLNGFMSWVGTGFLILFLWAAYLVVAFNFSFAKPPKLSNPFGGLFGSFSSGIDDIGTKRKERLTSRKKRKQIAKEALEKERKEQAKLESDRKTILYERDGGKKEKEEAAALKESIAAEKKSAHVLEVKPSGADAINPPIKLKKKEAPDVQLEIRKDSSSVSETLAPVLEDQEDKSANNFDPTLELSRYKYPKIEFLEEHGREEVRIDDEELERNKEQIIEKLSHYKIAIDKIYATVGPTVTLYEIVPAPGVRISKIKNLEDDIALSLSALGIRIIAPMPGKGTIGIEVPNKNKQTVSARSLLESDKFKNSKFDLPIALGKTISNEIFIADLARMPHLLIAGATGQGKSVGINVILASLLYKKHPSQLKFVLVDPKKVELSIFSKIEKHFLAKLPGEEEAIVTDTQKVVNTVKSLCIEMDARYQLLKDGHARNINEYNKKFVQRKLNPNKGHHFLPFIVLVIDEFADLILTAGKEVEAPIARLAQLARAVGIHLIVATQRPSVNIITGTIKANFPARIAYRVTAKVDSRTILDTGGADRLIGRGDMLMQIQSELIRLQCAFIDTPEVERITDFIGEQQGYAEAFLLPEVVEEGTGGQHGVPTDRDELFDEAARIIVRHQQGSTSLLQRRLSIGYNRAGRIIDQLHMTGIIGPFEGSKAREVKIPDEIQLEQFLSNL